MSQAVFKNSAYYMMASLLPTAVGFLMLPIYTRYLSPNDYGVVALVLSLQSFLPLIMTLQVHNSISRFYFDYYEDKEKLRMFISTILIVVLILSITVLVGLLVYLDVILSFVFPKTVGYNDIFLLGIIASFFGVFNSTFINLIRVQQKAKLFMKISLLLFLFSFVVNILEVIILQRGAYGVVEASVLTVVLSSLVYLYLVRGFFVFRFDFSKIIDPLKFSIPLIPHSLFGLIFMYSDRIILEKYVTLSTIGLYMFSIKIATIVKLIVMEFNNAFSPYFNKISKKSKKNAIKDLKNVSIGFIYILSILISVFACFSSDFMYYLFDVKYFLAWKIIPIILLGFFYQAHYIFSAIGIFYEKKTNIVLLATMISGILSLLLNILLIPEFGVTVAAYVFVFSYFNVFLVSYLLSKKIYYTEFINKKIVIINIYTLLVVVLSLYINDFFINYGGTIYIVKFFIILFGFYLGIKLDLINYSIIQKTLRRKYE